MKELLIKKRNNRHEEPYDPNKIINAVKLSANRLNKNLNNEFFNKLIECVEFELKELMISDLQGNYAPMSVGVDTIHYIVQNVLSTLDKEICEQYKGYVGYKKRFNQSFANILSSSKKIIYKGDKENANKNSSINSTQKELLSGLVSKELMLEYELPVAVASAHKDSWLYVHDLTDRIIASLNCCLFDAGRVMKGGFELNGVRIKEPNSIEVACNVICDIIMVASSQQYGGFTIPEIDTVLAPYVEKSIKKEREYYSSLGINGDMLDSITKNTVWRKLKQGMQSLEHKINCVNNALGW